MFDGILTALITPFKEGDIDEEGLHKLLLRQLDAGVQGVLLFGSTGEGPTLTKGEKKRLLEIACHTYQNRLPIIAGTGASSTQATIENTFMAKEMGAQAALIATPPYNKPSQDGLLAHYSIIHDAVDLPIILYNIPSRTGGHLSLATVQQLACLPRIVGIKECSGHLSTFMDFLQLSSPGFKVYAGDDTWGYAALALGAAGIFSVAANVFARALVELHQHMQEGRFAKARALHEEWLPFFKACFIETNPAPIKALMEWKGLPAGSPRLPLTAASASCVEALRQAMEALCAYR